MTVTRDYEITYITDPALDENKRGELNHAIDSKIDEFNGMISSNTDSLRRKLAYPVNNQRGGFMRNIQAQLPPEKVALLRHEMKRLSGLLRLSIIQSAARADVTTAIFEVIAKPQIESLPATVTKKPTKKITAEEVEEKIAEALEEEVK